MAGSEKRRPGDPNPTARSTEPALIANAVRSASGHGTSSGVLGRVVGLFSGRCDRSAKKRAIAAWEAERRDRQS